MAKSEEAQRESGQSGRGAGGTKTRGGVGGSGWPLDWEWTGHCTWGFPGQLAKRQLGKMGGAGLF
jgi:hypothetical protein